MNDSPTCDSVPKRSPVAGNPAAASSRWDCSLVAEAGRRLLNAGRHAVLLLGVMALSGCFTYFPVESPMPGEIARLHVPVSSAVADPGAPPETTTVEGTVLETGDTIVVEVQTRREIGAYREFVQENTYRIPRSELVGIEMRELSRGRSVGLGAAIFVGAGVLAWLAVRDGSARGGELGDSDNTPAGFTIRIPIG